MDSTIATAQPVIVAVKGDSILNAAVPRVELDLTKFHSGRWALQLDSAFARRTGPAVIVAQGVACLAVAWWAQLSPRSYMAMLRGAVFLAPLDIGFGQESIAASARLSPATSLPFPSVVANAGYPFVDRLLALADSWGSAFVDAGAPAEPVSTNLRGPHSDTLHALLPLLELLQTPRSAPAHAESMAEQDTLLA